MAGARSKKTRRTSTSATHKSTWRQWVLTSPTISFTRTTSTMHRRRRRCMGLRLCKSSPRTPSLRSSRSRKRQVRSNPAFNIFQRWTYLYMPAKAWPRLKVGKYIWWSCQNVKSHLSTPNRHQSRTTLRPRKPTPSKILIKSKYTQLTASTKSWSTSNMCSMKMSVQLP